jgi:hypothetical protein
VKGNVEQRAHSIPALVGQLHGLGI